MSFRVKKIAAFSLIEVVFALGILTFAMVGILGLMSVGLKSTRESFEQTEGSHLLTRLVADMEASSLDANYFSEMQTRVYGAPNPSSDTLQEGFDQFYWYGFDPEAKKHVLTATHHSWASYKVRIQCLENEITNQSTNLKKVLITVSWPPPKQSSTSENHEVDIMAAFLIRAKNPS